MTDEQVVQDEVEFVGPGKLLQQARDRAGLTVEQIAAKLNLKPQSILDIEQENFDSRISVTFTRGYLKAYAKQVGIEESEVLSAFEQLNACDKEPAKLQSFSRRVANQASDDRLMLVSYAILIVILGLFVAWWWQQGSESAGVQAPVLPAMEQAVESNTEDNSTNQQQLTAVESQEPPEQSQVVVTTDEQPVVADDVDEQAEQGTELSESELTRLNAEAQSFERQQEAVDTVQSNQDLAAEETSADTVTEDIIEQLDSADVSVAGAEAGAEPQVESTADTQNELPLGDPVELVFEFSADCWMQLTDATGEAIAYGVKTEGRVMPVSGIPPFEVILGAPGAVSISYAGQSVDMSVFPKGRTARFNLPLSSSEGE